MSNAVAQKPKFSQVINTDNYKKLINNTLQDPKKAQHFVSSITSAVAVNPALQECDSATIVSAALLGASLNLTPSPQMGQFYLVPFNDRKNGRTVATFVLGYKGYLQLAMRSGQYRRINAVPVKRGEVVSYDPFTEEIETRPINDPLQREAADTVGYYAMFEYTNGFRKTMYWSREKMEAHALKYSAGYKAKRGYTFWEKDFDSMALKTMLRQLISHWGIMSLEMQSAIEGDNGVIDSDLVPEYITEGEGITVDTPAPAVVTEPAETAEPAPTAAPPCDEQPLSLDDF